MPTEQVNSYQVCEGDKWDEEEAVAVTGNKYFDPEDAAKKFSEDRHHDMEWYDGSRTIWVRDGEALTRFCVEAESVLHFHVRACGMAGGVMNPRFN